MRTIYSIQSVHLSTFTTPPHVASCRQDTFWSAQTLLFNRILLMRVYRTHSCRPSNPLFEMERAMFETTCRVQ
uniref:AlNc14C206G8819 protein n=1 Tax=Albugo laibachii Nc14 TaxID=890382 RepID=F0WR11_9STRA|nr:AlNc14C206G8819 [Albugo laibachii Nc14]|eukprot:CCA23771.1 AlNc14C206G8819 [Albugo laibachii Nc14]